MKASETGKRGKKVRAREKEKSKNGRSCRSGEPVLVLPIGTRTEPGVRRKQTGRKNGNTPDVSDRFRLRFRQPCDAYLDDTASLHVRDFKTETVVFERLARLGH